MDVYHYWGEDLAFSDTGDLESVTGITKGVQRVLRRLLTNLGSYIWHPTDYGAGVRRFVGETINTEELTSLIRSQIFLESVVARSPEPQITIVPKPEEGGVFVQIRYVDAPTNTPAVVSFDITR